MIIDIKEVWKDVEDYEGLYKVSNLGKVKSLDRYVVKSNGVVQFKKGKILDGTFNQDGYRTIKLSRYGKSKTIAVHILVARAFVEKPKDYDNIKYEVNHIDFDRTNNIYTNLEWKTHKENINHSSSNNRYKIRDFYGEKNPNYGNHKLSYIYKNNPSLAIEKLARPGSQNGRAKKIELYDKDWNYIKTFDWIGECAEYLINHNLTKSKVSTIRTNIGKSIKENKIYLNHYYKKLA